MLGLSGHLGDRVSALVDDQMSSQEADRAWAHVVSCPGCRRLVERETWLKHRLAGMSGPQPGPQPRPGLVGALYDVDAWAEVDELERHGRARRSLTATAVGVGSLGVLALGLVAVTSSPANIGERPLRQTPTSISQGTGSGGSLRTGVVPTWDHSDGRSPGGGPTRSAGPVDKRDRGPVATNLRHRAR